MQFLIDTHILLWYLDGNSRLPDEIKAKINDERNTVIVSIASLWELAIKINLNKIETKRSLSEIQEYVIERDFTLLNISFNHLNVLVALPQYHGDPFDRLLIAQALSENISIISADQYFRSYPVSVIW